MGEHSFDYLPEDIKQIIAQLEVLRQRGCDLVLRDSFCKLRLAEIRGDEPEPAYSVKIERLKMSDLVKAGPLSVGLTYPSAPGIVFPPLAEGQDSWRVGNKVYDFTDNALIKAIKEADKLISDELCPDCKESVHDHCIYCSECADADHSECEKKWEATQSYYWPEMPLPAARELNFGSIQGGMFGSSPLIDSLKPRASETWTCEKGCGFEGNTEDRTECEVCQRGRGD
jgi:hypothetical protein